MILLSDSDQAAVKHFVGNIIDGDDCGDFGEDAYGIGAYLDGKLVAGVIYNQYYPRRSIQMHVAALPKTQWMTKQTLRSFFSYPFCQLGVRRINAIVAESNHHSLQLNKRLGFVIEGILREELDGVNAIIMGMLKNECKWIKERQNG